MIPQLLDHVATTWHRTRPGEAVPTSATVLGIDRSPGARVTLLLHDGGGRAVVAAKVARSTAGEASVTREHEALRAVRAALPDALLALLPEPLGLERVGGHLVLLQTALPGRPMTASYYAPGHTSSLSAVSRDFHAAATWLDAFQRSTQQEQRDLDIAPLLDRYRQQIGWSAEEADLFGEVLDRARAMPSVPVVAVHGDYWMGNLLVDSAGLGGVVDWELAATAGDPYADVFKFPTSYGFYLDRSCPWRGGSVRGHKDREDARGRWTRFGTWPNLLGFGHAFFGEGWFPELVRDWVESRERACGLAPLARSVAFPVFLARQALTLEDEGFRAGYRSTVLAFAAERERSWLWAAA